MIVEQAIFGEVKSGHGVRASSGDVVLAAELAPRLDLPDTAPPGADWSPFLSGFPYGNHFVVGRTFRDPEATRAGMVLSHALFVLVENIVEVGDLRPLVDLLMTEPVMPSRLPTLEIELSKEVPPPSSDLPALAAALSERGSGPVVRLGHNGFDQLVVSLWAILWPEVRRNLAFRLSFGPADLVETPLPALVCTPPGLAGRWRGHRLLDVSGSEHRSLGAAMLSGRSEGNALRRFAAHIGAELTTLSDLPLLEQAYRLSAIEHDTLSNTVAAIRLVERLAPDARTGASGKSELLDRLIQHLEDVTADDVLKLRNLGLRGFQSANDLWGALRKWVGRSDFAQAQDASFLLIVTDSTVTLDSTEEWRESILGGLLDAAHAPKTSFASAFWRWIDSDSSLVGPLWTMIKAAAGLEDRLVLVAPQRLKLASAQLLLEHARQGHFRVHGATLAAAYSAIEAARRQVEVEPAPAAAGLRLALRNATPAEIVASAVALGDPRLIDLAADRVAAEPRLLADIDVSGVMAREVWSAALQENAAAWAGPSDPRAAFDGVLIDILDGRQVPTELIGRLSKTPLGNLIDFGCRPELWRKLAGSVREDLIQATGRGWLDKAAAGAILPGMEAEAQAAIINDPKLDELLDRLAGDGMGMAVQIVLALPGFDEIRFNTWLRSAVSRSRPIPPRDSETIGRLARERRWQRVVDELKRALRAGRDDVRPALRACVSMIGVLDKWLLDLSPISATEKWQSFESLAVELYAIGPGENDLWERAGGHNSDLIRSGNGRSQWHDALARVRNGGRPQAERLIREMREDYPQNASLRFLAADDEFRSGRWGSNF